MYTFSCALMEQEIFTTQKLVKFFYKRDTGLLNRFHPTTLLLLLHFQT